jgi:hypothetical protein
MLFQIIFNKNSYLRILKRRILNLFFFKSYLEKKIKNFNNRIKYNKSFFKSKLTILIGPSFSIWKPSYITDQLLAFLFTKMFIKVIPIYCDGIQEVECNVYGGVWSGGEEFKKNCSTCQKFSKRQWRFHKIEALPLSKFISLKKKDTIKKKIFKLEHKQIENFFFNGQNYGLLARNILVNNYTVSDPKLIKGYKFLWRQHLINLLFLSEAYSNVINKVKPDRVISNESFYGMWNVLMNICKKKIIPFYNHFFINKNRVCFNLNQPAMLQNFRKSFTSFTIKKKYKKNLSPLVKNWLKGNRNYNLGILSQNNKVNNFFNADYKKDTVILAANIIWDLAALDKQLFFKNMSDWIVSTVKWFSSKKNLQLIIRAHPLETSHKLPTTIETVKSILIRNKLFPLPENIIFIDSDNKILFDNLYNLFKPKAILVHTSTVGFECVAKYGCKVITTGSAHYREMGFTYDPKNKIEYFEEIIKSFKYERGNIVNSDVKNLALDFIEFNQFHYSINVDIFRNQTFNIDPYKLEKFEKKLNRSAFGYVIKCIKEGSEIYKKNKWPPIS